MDRCQYCPLDSGTDCAGQAARRICDLIDPSHPDHRPDFVSVVLEAGAMPRPEYPPLATQAANLAKSLWDWATSGFPIASEAEQARRLAICAECEWFDAGPKRCRHAGCGCFMQKKIKMRSAHCPLDPPKW